MNNAQRLREHGLEIIRTAIDAVAPSRLIETNVRATQNSLTICDQQIGIDELDRLIVLGAGKASAAMAEGFEAALRGTPFFEKIVGQIQIPEGIESTLGRMTPLAVRPVGVNEPTQAAVEATKAAVRLLKTATAKDLVVFLLSGGASAIFSWPPDEIGLETKTKLIRFLSKAGASIEDLNTVRAKISLVKGGSFLQYGNAPFVTLAISDVIGDPPSIIGSGPTVQFHARAEDALQILRSYGADRPGEFQSVFDYLERMIPNEGTGDLHNIPLKYHIIGSIKTAMQTAGERARSLGYQTQIDIENLLRNSAEETGRGLAKRIRQIPETASPTCWIYGGETTVIVPNDGLSHQGGRNQQMALAALVESQSVGLENSILISIGTDGEDGPTDAAGGIADQLALERAKEQYLDLDDALYSCNAYPALSKLGSLIRTGPTGTNVMDLVVVLHCPS